MLKRTLKVTARDQEGIQVNLTASIRTTNLAPYEVAKLKAALADSLSDALRGLPYSKFNALNISIT